MRAPEQNLVWPLSTATEKGDRQPHTCSTSEVRRTNLIRKNPSDVAQVVSVDPVVGIEFHPVAESSDALGTNHVVGIAISIHEDPEHQWHVSTTGSILASGEIASARGVCFLLKGFDSFETFVNLLHLLAHVLQSRLVFPILLLLGLFCPHRLTVFLPNFGFENGEGVDREKHDHGRGVSEGANLRRRKRVRPCLELFPERRREQDVLGSAREQFLEELTER